VDALCALPKVVDKRVMESIARCRQGVLDDLDELVVVLGIQTMAQDEIMNE